MVILRYPITFASVNNSRSKSDPSPTADRFNPTIINLSIMKLYGIGGVGTGKLGNQVFAVKAGEQIVRQYQPVVSNPNTAAQVQTRAKMKLISQVAAVVAPTIAIPAEGLKSKRNMFISRNYNLMSFADDKATIALPSMQLTKGTLGFGTLSLTRDNLSLEAEVVGSIPSDINKCVFVLLEQTSEGKLLFAESRAVTVTSSTAPRVQFLSTMPISGSKYVALAYGVRPNTDRAKSYLDNMQASTAEAIAQVVAERRLLESDVTLTETIGAVDQTANNG